MRYHQSNKTQCFIEKQDCDNLMTFLPALFDELNPDEQVCNHAKTHLGKRWIFNKQDVQDHLVSIPRSIQKRTSLIKNFFRVPDTAYVLGAIGWTANTFAEIITSESRIPSPPRM